LASCGLAHLPPIVLKELERVVQYVLHVQLQEVLFEEGVEAKLEDGVGDLVEEHGLDLLEVLVDLPLREVALDLVFSADPLVNDRLQHVLHHPEEIEAVVALGDEEVVLQLGVRL